MYTATLIALLIILGSILGVLRIGSRIKKKTDISEQKTEVFSLVPDSFQKAMELLEAKNFEQAASLFRSSFEFELRALRDLRDNVPENAEAVFAVLKYSQHAHQHAYNVFRPYVNDSMKPRFDQAWKKYCYPQGGGLEDESQPFFGYKNENLQPIDSVKLAIKNMKKLLRFAEP